MTDEQKRPTAAAITSALAPFVLGGPLALASFTASLGAGERGKLEALSDAWVEGGMFMYVVLVGALPLGLGCAGALFVGVQRGSAAIAACAPVAALLTALGAMGFSLGMESTFAALAMVSPLDAATIAAAGTGEALNTVSFGFAATGGLLASCAIGALLGAAAQAGVARRLLLTSFIGFGLLAAVSLLSLLRTADLSELLRAVAHVAQADKAVLLSASGSEYTTLERLTALAMGLALLVFFGGAAVLRAQPRALVLFPLLGVSGLSGVGVYTLVRTTTQHRAEGLAAAMPARVPLLEADAFPSAEPVRWCLAAGGLVDCFGAKPLDPDVVTEELGAAVRLGERDPGGSLFGGGTAPVFPSVGLTPETTTEAFWAFLSQATEARAGGVRLVTQGPRRTITSAPELAGIAKLFEFSEREVPIQFVRSGEPCATDCVEAQVVGTELEVRGERWKRGDVDSTDGRLRVRVTLSPETSPATVHQLAAVAASHQAVLVVTRPE